MRPGTRKVVPRPSSTHTRSDEASLSSSPPNHQAMIQEIIPYDHILTATSDNFLSRKGGLMARHFDQQAIQRAAIIPKIAAHYSREELNAALAAARGAFLYSLGELAPRRCGTGPF